MQLGIGPGHPVTLGTHIRADGETFEVSAILLDSPPTLDFWQVPIDAAHATWGHRRFVLTIPKDQAATVHLALAIVRGSAFERVKAMLSTTRRGGHAPPKCGPSE